MPFTERQNLILENIVKDYIDLARPISSEFLEKKHDFRICPATIRIEMQELTKKGYLYQPHTSAGRVPTDKGYRFFVDKLLQSGFLEKKFFEEFEKIEKDIRDMFKFTQSLTRALASASSNFALSYIFEKDFLWKEGWEEILEEPEFKEPEYISNFARLLKNFEERVGTFEISPKIQIYIGRENPFPKAQDFSIIISRCFFPKRREGRLAILGPKRMGYERNINLIDSLTKLLENF